MYRTLGEWIKINDVFTELKSMDCNKSKDREELFAEAIEVYEQQKHGDKK